MVFTRLTNRWCWAHIDPPEHNDEREREPPSFSSGRQGFGSKRSRISNTARRSPWGGMRSPIRGRPRSKRSGDMKEGAAYQAASAGQQIGGEQWDGGGAGVRRRRTDKPRAEEGARATAAGSDVPALLHRSRRRSVRRGRMGAARGASSATSAARWCSSSATSRSRSPGRSRRPTSSSRSTSAARSARPSASAASSS